MEEITCKSSRDSDLRLCVVLPTTRIGRVQAPYGTVIRRLRDARSLSQQDVADLAGVSRDTVIRAEQSGNVGVHYLYQIANVLEEDITAFFGGLPAAVAEPPEWSVFVRLPLEQRASLLRLAKRYLGEAGSKEET